jgi:tetratricopeptide (TPR) repeat protein
MDRNKAWENNTTLLLTDVKTSSESAKSNYDAAHLLDLKGDSVADVNLKREYYGQAIGYALKSYEVYPDLTDNLMMLGNLYYKYKGNYDSVVYYYKKVLLTRPFDDRVYNNLHFFFQYDTNAQYQINVWKDIYHYKPQNFYVNNDLGFLYGKYMHDFDSAIYYMEKAVAANTTGNTIPLNLAHAYNDLGVFWFFKGEYEKSKDNYLKAVEIAPAYPDFLNNLGSAYNRLGDKQKAEECFAKAKPLMQGQTQQ